MLVTGSRQRTLSISPDMDFCTTRHSTTSPGTIASKKWRHLSSDV